MSNVTTSRPPVFEEVIFPNPGLSGSKWHFTESQKDGLEKGITQLGFAAVLLGTLFSLNFIQGLLNNDFITIASLFVIPAVSLVILPRIAKSAVARKVRKQDNYRRENAATVIDTLHENGWRYHDPNRDILNTIVNDSYPNLVNKDGVRYSTKQFYIGKEDINILLTLNDREVERNIKEAEKQARIEFMIKNYENENGTMSHEKKAGFEAALILSL